MSFHENTSESHPKKRFAGLNSYDGCTRNYIEMADADNNISAARRPTPTMNTSTERWNHKLQFPLVEFSIPLVFLQRVWGAAGNASGDIASMNNSNSAAIVASFADGKCQRHCLWLIWYWGTSGLPSEGWKGLGSGYYGEWRWWGREIGCTLISFPISLTTSWLTPTSLPLLVGDIYMNYWGWGAALSAYTAVIILSTRGVPGRGGDQRESTIRAAPGGLRGIWCIETTQQSTLMTYG